MIPRSEIQQPAFRGRNVPLFRPSQTSRDVVDYLFDRVFGDETSNAVIGELCHLAERDAEIRARVRLREASHRGLRQLAYGLVEPSKREERSEVRK